MSVRFSELVIQNNNGLNIEVRLEIPIGTLFNSVTIGPLSSKSIPINSDNIQSIKIIIKDSGHGGRTDQMEINLHNSGNPYNLYIERIDANTNIGRIRGNVSVKF